MSDGIITMISIEFSFNHKETVLKLNNDAKILHIKSQNIYSKLKNMHPLTADVSKKKLYRSTYVTIN